MSDTKYWDDYYEYWDRFVKEWFKERENEKRSENEKYPIWEKYKEISEAYNNAVAKLNFDELPNPYLGDPKNGVDAVIINLNPGGSEKDENKEGTDATQFYSNLKDTDKECGKGWLMWKFVDDAKCSYKRFVGNDDESVNWSQLNPKLRGHKPEVCGVKWWQGVNPKWVGGKMGWIRRIYGNKNLCPSRVLALELCPFHSVKFGGFHGPEYKNKIVPFIKEKVIDYAIMAAEKVAVEGSCSPLVVAIGKSVADVLDKVAGTSAQKKQWTCDDGIRDWPSGIGGKIKRIYRLYKVDSTDGRHSAGILVTWMSDKKTRSNPAPGVSFSKVEGKIREDMARILMS